MRSCSPADSDVGETVDIAVGNPTMFAFIGRGANVTIHDAEGGLLATGTVPVVPVSLPAQTTTAVAAELSFAPALETLDSGDAVSAALAAVGVTEAVSSSSSPSCSTS